MLTKNQISVMSSPLLLLLAFVLLSLCCSGANAGYTTTRVSRSSFTSYYYYYGGYSYYTYYGYRSSPPPPPPPYCASTQTGVTLIQPSSVCFPYAPLTIDKTYLTSDGTTTAVGRGIIAYRDLTFDNGTVLTGFFLECEAKITAAVCRRVYVDCADTAMTSCKTTCEAFNACRKGVVDRYNANSTSTYLPLNVTETDYWEFVCTFNPRCGNDDTTFCCWTPNPSGLPMGGSITYLMMLLTLFVALVPQIASF